MARNMVCVAPLVAACLGVIVVGLAAPIAEGRGRRVDDANALALADAGPREVDEAADADDEDAAPPRRRPATRRLRDGDPGADIDDRGGAANRRDRDRDADADEAEARREARRRRVNETDWFRGPGYVEPAGREPGGFPSGEVHDFVVANARAAASRAVYRRAESSLNNAIRRAKRDFESSEDLQKALAAEKQAYEDYQAARRAALESVVSDPQYLAILSIHGDLTERIATQRQYLESEGLGNNYFAVHSPAATDLLSLAMLRMNVAGDARMLEQSALEDSEELREARAKLRATADRISKLRKDFDRELRDDEDLAAARAILEDARIARLTAAAYLKGAMLAADEALDFAYHLHRYDRHVPFNTYPYFGYPNGGQYYVRY